MVALPLGYFHDLIRREHLERQVAETCQGHPRAAGRTGFAASKKPLYHEPPIQPATALAACMQQESRTLAVQTGPQQGAAGSKKKCNQHPAGNVAMSEYIKAKSQGALALESKNQHQIYTLLASTKVRVPMKKLEHWSSGPKHRHFV